MSENVTGLERKKKYQKKPTNDLNLNLDANTLHLYGRYALSENANVHFSVLNNLYKLLNMLSDTIYVANNEGRVMKSFVQDVLKNKLERHIYNRESLFVAVYGTGKERYETIPKESFEEIGNGEVEWIEESILNLTNTIAVHNGVRELLEACNNYLAAEPNKKIEMAERVKEINDIMHTTFRRNAMHMDNEEDNFTLENMSSNVERIIQNMNKPSYKLKTGVQAFNDILGGGASPGRCYILFGLPGEGKTTTMINLLYQMKNCNKGYVCKDPTKKPALLMLSMENKVSDLVTTFFSMVNGHTPLNEYKTEEVVHIMNTRGLGLSPENPIEIMIRYKPVNSVDTNYCYQWIEDLTDDGYEVIGFFLDYIMRIKPVLWDNEERFRLGNVVNELCNLAKHYEIPVITASQLNRTAAEVIDKGRSRNQIDLVNMVGRSNIGESIQIDQNTDASIFLTPETLYNEQGIEQKFLGIKLGKHRYPIGKKALTSFYIPYRLGSDILLEVDVNGPRKTRKTLGEDSSSWTERIYKGASRKFYGTNLDVENINKDINGNTIKGVNDEGDLFIGGTVISNKKSQEESPRQEESKGLQIFVNHGIAKEDIIIA